MTRDRKVEQVWGVIIDALRRHAKYPRAQAWPFIYEIAGVLGVRAEDWMTPVPEVSTLKDEVE